MPTANNAESRENVHLLLADDAPPKEQITIAAAESNDISTSAPNDGLIGSNEGGNTANLTSSLVTVSYITTVSASDTSENGSDLSAGELRNLSNDIPSTMSSVPMELNHSDSTVQVGNDLPNLNTNNSDSGGLTASDITAGVSPSFLPSTVGINAAINNSTLESLTGDTSTIPALGSTILTAVVDNNTSVSNNFEVPINSTTAIGLSSHSILEGVTESANTIALTTVGLVESNITVTVATNGAQQNISEVQTTLITGNDTEFSVSTAAPASVSNSSTLSSTSAPELVSNFSNIPIAPTSISVSNLSEIFSTPASKSTSNTSDMSSTPTRASVSNSSDVSTTLAPASISNSSVVPVTAGVIDASNSTKETSSVPINFSASSMPESFQVTTMSAKIAMNNDNTSNNATVHPLGNLITDFSTGIESTKSMYLGTNFSDVSTVSSFSITSAAFTVNIASATNSVTTNTYNNATETLDSNNVTETSPQSTLTNVTGPANNVTQAGSITTPLLTNYSLLTELVTATLSTSATLTNASETSMVPSVTNSTATHFTNAVEKLTNTTVTVSEAPLRSVATYTTIANESAISLVTNGSLLTGMPPIYSTAPSGYVSTISSQGSATNGYTAIPSATSTLSVTIVQSQTSASNLSSLAPSGGISTRTPFNGLTTQLAQASAITTSFLTPGVTSSSISSRTSSPTSTVPQTTTTYPSTTTFGDYSGCTEWPCQHGGTPLQLPTNGNCYCICYDDWQGNQCQCEYHLDVHYCTCICTITIGLYKFNIIMLNLI